MPSPVRGANNLGADAQSRARLPKSPVWSRSEPGGWSDDIEAHEARMRNLQPAREAKVSEDSSEDTGRRTSAELSATTMSTASVLPSVHDSNSLNESGVSKVAENDEEERPDVVTQLPKLSKIYYQRPRYSRRVKSKSEPLGSAYEGEIDGNDELPTGHDSDLSTDLTVSCGTKSHRQRPSTLTSVGTLSSCVCACPKVGHLRAGQCEYHKSFDSKHRHAEERR